MGNVIQPVESGNSQGETILHHNGIGKLTCKSKGKSKCKSTCKSVCKSTCKSVCKSTCKSVSKSVCKFVFMSKHELNRN